MAGHRALSAVAVSVVSLLNREIEGMAQLALRPTAFLAGSGAAQFSHQGLGAAILVHPYRIVLDPASGPVRATGLAARTAAHPGSVVRLRLLVCVSAEDPETELAALGLAMVVLQTTPVLGVHLLDAAGDWDPADQVRLMPVPVEGGELTDAFGALGLPARPAVVFEAAGIVIRG